MTDLLLIIAPLLIAFISVSIMHSRIVKIANMKHIVDNPNARKLQKEPVPILGGVLVFFGIVLSVAGMYLVYDNSSLFMVFTAMMIMLYTGTIDDIIDLRPSTRFIMQILAVALLIFSNDYGLDNLHGLWGIGMLPKEVMVPLTIFACVGIINALNLIDGVDGLSSGYCIMASIVFGTVFFLAKTNRPMMTLALATIGSLIPFFMHNVFGRRSKMFIGDGGTLLMGIIMSVFVIKSIQSEGITRLLDDNGYSSIAFTLAVLAIPVFDTVRVMLRRMLKGESPFHPDKTHLHHLFIELGFSHIVTTFFILLFNSIIILCWWLSGRLGMSFEVQLYLIVLLGILFTTGFYYAWRLLQRYSPAAFQQVVDFNHRVRPQREGIFLVFQKWIDRV